MLRIVFLSKQKYRIIKILILVLIFITSVCIHPQQLQLAPSTKQASATFGYSISHTDEWLVAGAKDDTTQAGRTSAAYFFKYVDDAWVEKQKVGMMLALTAIFLV